MNLKDKLKGLPTIYYTNLDHRTDRRDYMESQFDHWKINNFHRISSTKYLSSEQDKWEHLVLDSENLGYGVAAVANSVTHVEMIKNWLDTTDEEYLILMEDDYDLSLIEYWNFDWEYLMNNIPQNWDCIQLGYENSEMLYFFLHPVQPLHGFGPCLINRHYAEKLVKLHYHDGYFKLNLRANNKGINRIYGTVDGFILEGGRTYSLPLITNNPDMGSDYDILYGTPRPWFRECRDIYYDWWKNEHHKFSLEEFFTFGKKNDTLMMKEVRHKKEFIDKAIYQ